MFYLDNSKMLFLEGLTLLNAFSSSNYLNPHGKNGKDCGGNE